MSNKFALSFVSYFIERMAQISDQNPENHANEDAALPEGQGSPSIFPRKQHLPNSPPHLRRQIPARPLTCRTSPIAPAGMSRPLPLPTHGAPMRPTGNTFPPGAGARDCPRCHRRRRRSVSTSPPSHQATPHEMAVLLASRLSSGGCRHCPGTTRNEDFPSTEKTGTLPPSLPVSGTSTRPRRVRKRPFFPKMSSPCWRHWTGEHFGDCGIGPCF